MVVIAVGFMLNAQFEWKRLPIRYPTAIGLIVFCSGVGLIAVVVIRGM